MSTDGPWFSRSRSAMCKWCLFGGALAGAMLLPAPAAPARKAPVPENPVTIPTPTVPGAPPLPGPEVSEQAPEGQVQALSVAPSEARTGKQVTVSGSGLSPNKTVTLTWTTARVSWEVSPTVEGVDYLGPASPQPVTVVLATATTNASGSFNAKIAVPNDYGGPHTITAVVEGVKVGVGVLIIATYATLSPKRGPVGTPITITYHGLGASLFEGAAALDYDNHFMGDLTANWTRGTAQFKIRAAGAVGRHTIQMFDAITFNYLNIQQTSIPWASGATLTFTVTKGRPRVKPSIEWPLALTPTVYTRSTVNAAELAKGSTATATVSPGSGDVGATVSLSATGLSSAPATLRWVTVLGTRVNCAKGSCLSFKDEPLRGGEALTPSGGSLATTFTVPEGLGGWHAVQILQNGEVMAQATYFVLRSVVGRGLSKLVLREGQEFTLHLRGVGWTQLDNGVAIDYDNSYVGYACGFNSSGNVVMNLVATGGPGVHLIEAYPMLYNQSPAYANTPYGDVPMLTFRNDLPGLALGYDLPVIRLAIKIVR